MTALRVALTLLGLAALGVAVVLFANALGGDEELWWLGAPFAVGAVLSFSAALAGHEHRWLLAAVAVLLVAGAVYFLVAAIRSLGSM